jgi:hypothetical protein
MKIQWTAPGVGAMGRGRAGFRWRSIRQRGFVRTAVALVVERAGRHARLPSPKGGEAAPGVASPRSLALMGQAHEKRVQPLAGTCGVC